ncbi:MAG: homoserine kinase [Betaproteobacteria bacterium]|nr:homoserine kinase [Betaproteobacteria bacterium]
MAVFTPVSHDDLSAWLTRYDVGQLLEQNAIAAGIENTNYFVTTTQGRFVLTLFEKLQPSELPYYLGLMDHLARRGIPCPRPIPDQNGQFFDMLCGKPASLVTRLSGQSQMSPGAAHCAVFGDLVATLHKEAADYAGSLHNPRGPAWWVATAARVRPFLNEQQNALLDRELAYQSLHRSDDLPRGAIHADLFRDNVLFDGERVGGVIDFYFAGTDAWLYDLAIVVNDWCMTAQASLDPQRVQALVGAYNARRPVTATERAAWPVMLRAGALRFWLSRLFDLHLPRPGEIIHPHDPTWFERILHHHVHNPSPWPL